jgi:hypothetical protein
VKIDNLYAVAPRIVKIAPKRRLKFQLVFAGNFLADFRQLGFVPHHDSEMPHPPGKFFTSDGEKLVLAELEEGVSFTAVELFEIENILVERNRLFDVVHFNGDVIATVNLDAHDGLPLLFRSLDACRRLNLVPKHDHPTSGMAKFLLHFTGCTHNCLNP